MGDRASSHSDIAALKPRFRQISYASGGFFTLAMHQRLLTNFFLGRFHLGLGPSLHRLSPHQPHFLDIRSSIASASLRFSPEFARRKSCPSGVFTAAAARHRRLCRRSVFRFGADEVAWALGLWSRGETDQAG